MILPEEKIKEVEYYECYTGLTTYDKGGRPIQKDKIVLHFGEKTKKKKLFGITVFSKTVEDETETFTFQRNRSPEGENKYGFRSSRNFLQLRNQLEVYFDSECLKLYRALKNHELTHIIH